MFLCFCWFSFCSACFNVVSSNEVQSGLGAHVVFSGRKTFLSLSLGSRILVPRWCQNVVLRQEHKTVLPDLPDSDQISALLDLNQPSPVLPFPVFQGHLSPPAAGLAVYVPHPNHQNHAQTSRAAQQHAQLPGAVSGDDVWVFLVLVWSFGRTWWSLGFGADVWNVWFSLLVVLEVVVEKRFGVWVNNWSEVWLRTRQC